MKYLAIVSTIANIGTDKQTDSDIVTVQAGTVALAKAAKAFVSMKSEVSSKAAVFGSLARIARLTYDDATLLVQLSAKDSTLRQSLRKSRHTLVQRMKSNECNVVHDAQADAALVVRIDRIVSALGTIAENAAVIVRKAAVAKAS